MSSEIKRTALRWIWHDYYNGSNQGHGNESGYENQGFGNNYGGYNNNQGYMTDIPVVALTINLS
jgi:hypothetical protein